jgi:hypothetical protein
MLLWVPVPGALAPEKLSSDIAPDYRGEGKPAAAAHRPERQHQQKRQGRNCIHHERTRTAKHVALSCAGRLPLSRCPEWPDSAWLSGMCLLPRPPERAAMPRLPATRGAPWPGTPGYPSRHLAASGKRLRRARAKRMSKPKRTRTAGRAARHRQAPSPLPFRCPRLRNPTRQAESRLTHGEGIRVS